MFESRCWAQYMIETMHASCSHDMASKTVQAPLTQPGSLILQKKLISYKWQELEEHGLLVSPQNPNPRALEYADLERLKYLGAVMKACLPCQQSFFLPFVDYSGSYPDRHFMNPQPACYCITSRLEVKFY